MASLSAPAASFNQRPLRVAPPSPRCSFPGVLCAVRLCPNPAVTGGLVISVSSFSSSFVRLLRKNTVAAAAFSSCCFRQEPAPYPAFCLRLLLAPPKNPSRPLSREQERRGGLRCGRGRTTGRVYCGGIESGARVEVKQVERVEEGKKDDVSVQALEAEIYDFMRKSAKPRDFPTKEELISGGRMDLVEAIVAHGGWFAYGWDFHDDETGGSDDDDDEEKWLRQHTIDSPLREANSASLKDNGPAADWFDEEIFQEHRSRSATTGLASASSSTASSSDRPIERIVGEESGIEGILSRLEQERSLSFMVGPKDKEFGSRVLSDKDCDFGSAVGGKTRGRQSVSLHSKKQFFPDFDGAGETFSNGNIKSGENLLNGIPMDDYANPMDQSASDMKNGSKEPVSPAGTYQNQIDSRLQYLESELTSVLSSLRSRTDAVMLHKGQQSSLKELSNLSDAWEFQENEIMNARDKLRSARAKLAVLEGKMALEIIEAQKILEEKQKRFDAAQRAVNLLRTAYVVWPNSASEVLLAGSFDGWTSQRRMERSSTGVFSLCLKLYPGQYEIKFIVDGVWKVDPLRPVVYNNGFENNLLLVS